MLPKISLYDKEFAHLGSYCGYDAPQFFEWDRSGADNGIALFTERCFDDAVKAPDKIKIAWLLEPPAIHDYGYAAINAGKHANFDYILTFDHRIHERFPDKALFWTPGGTWLWKRDWSIYKKSQNVSMLASTAKGWTDGHKLRTAVIAAFKDRLDMVAGYGHNPVEPKILAYQPFRYSIVIENSRLNWYWTDKLLECFLTGTIPIFWGCPDIGKYFNLDGIIQWESVGDMPAILDSLSEEDYLWRFPAVVDNFNRASACGIVEDYMWEQSLKGVYAKAIS